MDLTDLTIDVTGEIVALQKQYKIKLIEAVCYYCEKHDIEIELVASFIKKNANLKALIEEEAENLNFLDKKSRLPM